MWLLSHHNWITGQNLFKGSNGSFSKELIYVLDKVLLGRQRGVREDSVPGSWESGPATLGIWEQNREEESARETMLTSHWVCGTELSGRGYLVRSW